MTKYEQLAQLIREGISAGEFQPGDRFPPRTEIGKQYGVSLETAQRAMKQLGSEGWLTARGCKGTVVAESPPYLRHYGLYFAYRQSEDRTWVRFWSVLKAAAEEVLDESPCTLSIFYGLEVTASQEQFRRFHDTLREQALAGMLFAGWPVPHMNTILEREPRLPAAIVAANSVPGLLTLKIPVKRIFSRACSLIAERGCRRLAALLPVYYFRDSLEVARQTIVDAGLDLNSRTLQPLASLHEEHAIRAQIELIFAAENPPDVLYLGDDNPIETVIDVLKDLGKRVPEDVLLVCWGMFPWPETYAVPVLRLGVDMRDLVKGARDGIDAARRGEPLPDNLEVSDIIVIER